jgi:excisionase family DNA binding protein
MQNNVTAAALATVAEAAKFLRVSKSQVYVLLDKGELRGLKIGGARRLRWQDIHEYVEKCLAADRRPGA